MKKISKRHKGSQLELASESSSLMHFKSNRVFGQIFKRNRTLKWQ